jgi:hypothetical protein
VGRAGRDGPGRPDRRRPCRRAGSCRWRGEPPLRAGCCCCPPGGKARSCGGGPPGAGRGSPPTLGPRAALGGCRRCSWGRPDAMTHRMSRTNSTTLPHPCLRPAGLFPVRVISASLMSYGHRGGRSLRRSLERGLPPDPVAPKCKKPGIVTCSGVCSPSARAGASRPAAGIRRLCGRTEVRRLLLRSNHLRAQALAQHPEHPHQEVRALTPQPVERVAFEPQHGRVLSGRHGR